MNPEDPLSLAEFPRLVVEKIEATLSYAGIQLPTLGIQFVIFIIACTLCAALVKRGWPKLLDNIPNFIGIIVTSLIGLLIILHWGIEVIVPIPDRVSGIVILSSGETRSTLGHMRLELLNVRKETITIEGGAVDTQTGRFALAYDKRFGERPYFIRAIAGDCKYDQRVSVGKLRAGADIQITFRCE